MSTSPERLLALHEHFWRAGDLGMVREIEHELARTNVRPPDSYGNDEPPALEHAVTVTPAKRGPGRPRKTPV